MEPWEKYQSSESDGPWAKYGGESEATPIPYPSMLSVAGNAAWKGLASVGDTAMNVAGSVGNALIPPPLRPGAMQNPIATGLEAVGAIRPENEPQTAGQRVLDTSIRAGTNMLANPIKGGVQAAFNVVQGLTSGALAQITKEATGSDLLALAVGLVTPMALSRQTVPSATGLNPTKAQTLKEAQDAGLKVVPSYVRKTVGTEKLEGIGGKAAIKQQTQADNVETINELARKSIGMKPGTPISKESLEQVRDAAFQPYGEVEALRANTTNLPWFPRYHSTNLLEEVKAARNDARIAFEQYKFNRDGDTLKKAKQFLKEADSIEDDIEMIAKAAGKPDLIDRVRAGRQLGARTYDVERATNFADGNVSPAVLGTMFRKKLPLSGELRVIGKFASAFPDSVREGSKIQSAGVSGTEAGMGAILSMGGAAATGSPLGLLAGGLPLVRGPVRNLMLSDRYQSGLLNQRQFAPMNESLLKGALVGKSLSDYQEAVK